MAPIWGRSFSPNQIGRGSEQRIDKKFSYGALETFLTTSEKDEGALIAKNCPGGLFRGEPEAPVTPTRNDTNRRADARRTGSAASRRIMDSDPRTKRASGL